MKRLISALLLTISIISGAQTLEQTAGIYYAYPGPMSLQTPAPDGYKPIYISHYGRHGSRWVTEDKRYTDVLKEFEDTANLTPLGMDVRRRLQAICADAVGRSGSLSPLGERQHHDIAARMIGNFPEVFTDTSVVEAVSSTSLRCAMSMSYFTESLKEVNPRLNVKRTAYDKDMDYIAHTSAEGKEFSADTAAWRKTYWEFVAETVSPDRLMTSLFINPDKLTPAERFKLYTGLYWIASDMQDVDLDISLYDIFTYDELLACWRCINARMYVCNGNAPMAQGVMKHCADNLLNDIITKADAALSGNGVSADLRFGHDTHLLRLLALMGIDGCSNEETDFHKFHEAWQDYRLSPMAANLQLIFYGDDSGDVIVKLLLNENEVTLPVEGVSGPYYSWLSLREYLTEKMLKMERDA